MTAKSAQYNSMIKAYNHLTDKNMHGEALRLLAYQMNMVSAYKILDHINAIHEIEGQIPYSLLKYREDIRQRVERVSRDKMGAAFDKLN